MARTFWLEDGWLRWAPGDPALSWLGAMTQSEDGGFRRICGAAPGELYLIAHTGQEFRLSYDLENFVDSMRLEEVRHG